MSRRLLDLFCGAGGAAMGYSRAGFDVTGVDIRPQPRYPFAFVRADALTFPLDGVDAIHASPPCEDHMQSRLYGQQAKGTAWILGAIRARLTESGRPWVIENVPGAPMRADLILCGCLFGLTVKRQRWFETSWHAFDLRSPCHHGVITPLFRPMHGPWYRLHGRVPTRREAAMAMGIDWMSGSEYRQAIPPAYTEHIGRMLLAVLPQAAAS